jgi:hypothetical protein
LGIFNFGGVLRGLGIFREEKKNEGFVLRRAFEGEFLSLERESGEGILGY